MFVFLGYCCAWWRTLTASVTAALLQLLSNITTGYTSYRPCLLWYLPAAQWKKTSICMLMLHSLPTTLHLSIFSHSYLIPQHNCPAEGLTIYTWSCGWNYRGWCSRTVHSLDDLKQQIQSSMNGTGSKSFSIWEILVSKKLFLFNIICYNLWINISFHYCIVKLLQIKRWTSSGINMRWWEFELNHLKTSPLISPAWLD